MSVMKGYIPLAKARGSQAETLDRAIDAIRKEIAREQRRSMLSGPGPIFLGIGASFAAAAPAVWVLRARGIHAWRLNAGDYPLPFPASRHPVVGVSQSGRSVETLAAFESVEEGRRLSVVNAAGSAMAALAAATIWLGALPDSYASTIGYTATVAALGMVAEAWDDGSIDPSWTEVPAAMRALEGTLRRQVGELAALLEGVTHVDCAGVAPSVGSAEMGALLLREVARIPATGMSTRQYLHGALESAGGGAHILFGEERELALARTLAQRGHPTILIGPLAPVSEPRLAHVAVPPLPPAQRAILEAVVLQTLAVEAAIARGLDPDAFHLVQDDTKADGAGA